MQSLISQFALQKLIFAQLSQHLYPLFEHAYQRHATRWAENGDALSLMYAGTAALKGDLTSNIKASGSGGWKSLLGDLQTNVQRIMQGAMNDEGKQEVVDFLLVNLVFINWQGKFPYQREVVIKDEVREKVRLELDKK